MMIHGICPQGTRKGYPYYTTASHLPRSIVGVPLAGTLRPLPGLMRFVMLPCFIALLCFTFSPGAFAASNGRISGQLLDGTNHNAALAGQSVTLQMTQGDTAKDLKAVKTDAHGAFSFANLATDASTGYALYTRYQGAQYTSDIVHLDKKP
ncbi:MAG TPA: carboxypeptidase-like regulatory domain-containing protein, partial [Ktedonobacteraceae bacterium]|nr:carboxypeptidase-like regulatory domain-containing protein [Ktedonobacteraceae bacterium]